MVTIARCVRNPAAPLTPLLGRDKQPQRIELDEACGIFPAAGTGLVLECGDGCIELRIIRFTAHHNNAALLEYLAFLTVDVLLRKIDQLLQGQPLRRPPVNA